jgi:hypothetical protein
MRINYIPQKIRGVMVMTFTTLAAADAFLGSDASLVAGWNTKFGVTFSYCSVSGSTITLGGGSNITTLSDAFFNCPTLTSVTLPTSMDALVYIDGAFSLCSALTSVTLPTSMDALNNMSQMLYGCTLLTTVTNSSYLLLVGNGCFQNCTSLTNLDLSSCLALGSSLGDDLVFDGIIGKTITLTVPVALRTCNGGNPDGDIQYLMDNNTETIVYV